MLSYVTYYCIDRTTRKVLVKSYDPNIVRAYYEAAKFVKQVYLLSVVSHGIQPNETA